MPAPAALLSLNEIIHTSLRQPRGRPTVFRRGVSEPATLPAPLPGGRAARRKGWARLLSHLLLNRRGFRAGVKSLGRMACNWLV